VLRRRRPTQALLRHAAAAARLASALRPRGAPPVSPPSPPVSSSSSPSAPSSSSFSSFPPASFSGGAPELVLLLRDAQLRLGVSAGVKTRVAGVKTGVAGVNTGGGNADGRDNATDTAVSGVDLGAGSADVERAAALEEWGPFLSGGDGSRADVLGRVGVLRGWLESGGKGDKEALEKGFRSLSLQQLGAPSEVQSHSLRTYCRTRVNRCASRVSRPCPRLC